jgi:hypothetical protein
MLMAELPIAVVMRRRSMNSPWSQPGWMPVAVCVDRDDRASMAAAGPALHGDDNDPCIIPGLSLQLYPDENDGYFENWVAPEPKVFILWRLENDRPSLVAASVSYGEGTRMLDSGELADGVIMPPDIHAWLGAYLRRHYEPPARGRRAHG